MTKAVADDDLKVNFLVGYCYVRDNQVSFPAELKQGPEMSGDVFGIKGVAGDAVSGEFSALLTLVTSRQGGYDVYSATIPPHESFSALKIRHCVAGSEGLPELQPWPHHGTFLFVRERPAEDNDDKVDFNLYEGQYNPMDEGQTGFTENKVSVAGFKGSSFCLSPSGEFIFYYESYRDKPNDDPKAEQVSCNVTRKDDGTPTGDDTVHRIVASRLTDGKFSEDFPFCEVSHPIDGMEITNITNDASSFITTYITDAANSLADLHYIAVPHTLSSEIEAFGTTQTFVYAGHECEFQMDVRNHGNMIIGGFDVDMIDPDDGGRVVDTAHIELEPKSMVMNASSLGWGNPDEGSENPTPRLTDEEKKGWFMPGKLMSYLASFNIPDNWEDDKRVILRITNAWTPGIQSNGLSAQAADGSGVEYGAATQYHHEGVDSVLLMHKAEAGGLLYDPAETIGATKGVPSNSAITNRATPKLGDPLGVVKTVTTALGGAAALMAGYSARRVKNEREQNKRREGGEA